MADEPILCFDGDDAGRRAAYRAVDLALPFLKPGKSLKFASLPDGQDPDDLARSGGREAIEDVLNGARPLAQMLWTRESEAGPFDTPERRAALEARINEVTAAIGDETVRRYYRQDFSGAAAPDVRADQVSSRRGGFGQKSFRPAIIRQTRLRPKSFGRKRLRRDRPPGNAIPARRERGRTMPMSR